MSVVELVERREELIHAINSEEEQRAARFIKPQSGLHYRCIRGQLRKLLGAYLTVQASEVEFEYAEYGKPGLKNKSELKFNLSHSRDMAVFAFCLEKEIGVDIEFMREQKNLPGMIRHVGSPMEQDELNELQGPVAYDAFYRLWTRKEAFIKAVGRGLGMGLRAIDIGSGKIADDHAVAYNNKELPEWLIKDIPPPEGYRLALCINRHS